MQFPDKCKYFSGTDFSMHKSPRINAFSISEMSHEPRINATNCGILVPSDGNAECQNRLNQLINRIFSVDLTMATNRKEVSLEEKMEIIKELENGASMRRFVQETGLTMANSMKSSRRRCISKPPRRKSRSQSLTILLNLVNKQFNKLLRVVF